MKRLSWKYLAGLVDGEGCIDAMPGKYNTPQHTRFYIRPRLRIAMADSALDLLKMLHANHGGSLHSRAKHLVNPKWQSATSWELVGYRDTCPFLRNIVNHLVLKREQARLCLWMETHMKGQKVGQTAVDLIREELALMKRDSHRLSEAAQTRVWDAIVETPNIGVT